MGLKILVVFIVIILLAFAAGVFAYTQGYGYPTQQTVAQQLFANKDTAATTLFASDVSSDKISSMLDPVVESGNATIDGMDRAMNTSTVYTTVSTPEGGQVHYKVSMVRSGIGWKISNVELYFPSQN